MAKFLGGKNMYDDDGALVTGLPFQFKKGIYSESVSSPSGSINNMYDNLSTTHYLINANIVSTTNWVKWDFKRKIPFDNLHLYCNIGFATIYLEGSNDNSNWTVLATQANAGAANFYNLIDSEVKYRYIRIRSVTLNNASCGVKIYTIGGQA